MGEGAERSVKSKRYLTIAFAFLVVGVIAASLVYRGSITSRITGSVTGSEKAMTESEVATKLVNYLNIKYGDAKFFRSEDLGSIYHIVVEHDKQNYDFYATKDGKYFSNSMEQLNYDSISNSTNSSMPN